MELTVKTSKGELYKIEVKSEEETIASIKAEILKQMGTPGKKIQLIHGGKLLKDESALKEYTIPSGSTLHLISPGGEKGSPGTGSEKDKKSVSSSALSAEKAGSVSDAESRSAGHSVQGNQSSDRLGSHVNNLFSFLGGNAPSAQGNRAHSGQSDAEQIKQAMMASDAGGMNLDMMRNAYAESPEVRQACQNKMREMLKNPEQLKELMEASLSLNNVPDEYKSFIVDQTNRLAELSKDNPEQFNALLNQIIESSSAFGMPGMPGMGRGPGSAPMPFGAPSGASSAGSSSNSVPFSNMPHGGYTMVYPSDFQMEEVAKKYPAELETLKNIGYEDEKMVLLALHYTHGDVSLAINLICDWSNGGSK